MNDRSLRDDLALCHRLMHAHGMDDLIYTHVSVRVDQDHFLMSPYGLLFDEVGPDDAILLDVRGRIRAPTSHAVNTAGFVIHSAIYTHRPDVRCVIHSHANEMVAVASIEQGLLPISQAALAFYDNHAYYDYAGLATELKEREQIVRALADKSVLLMRNHGALIVGQSLPAAFERCFYLLQACRIQLQAMATGDKLITPSAEVCEFTARQQRIEGTMKLGERLWQSLRRRHLKGQELIRSTSTGTAGPNPERS
jgi:ribulose-5-phosphate 4-epimerase/fuculose-1-phosphate aldolase